MSKDHPPHRALFITIVLDGVGIGAQPDAALFGDEGSHTLGHVCAVARPRLPHLASLGLGRISALQGVPAAADPLACYGKMQEISAGKDSTTGHWELAGIHLKEPRPTYPGGFPASLIQRFLDRTGVPGVLGNAAASGTEIIGRLGEEHLCTGFPIVYTSADSVFQIAAHVAVTTTEDLYRIARITRDQACTADHAVDRVIARPFTGDSGAFRRLSWARKDFSLLPPRALPEVLQEAGVRTIGIGKVASLFSGRGFDLSIPTASDAHGQAEILRLMRESGDGPTFLWANLVDCDELYGHRNNPEGFARALEGFDSAIPELTGQLPRGGRLVITADHGNDPTTPSTDHSREYVPLLYFGDGSRRDLGIRATFRDHAATVAAYFGIGLDCGGTAFG